MENPVQCPECGSEAAYKNGKIPSGKQRYICLICNRQFILDNSWPKLKYRPLCPICGANMHIHSVRGDFRRFRCSKYPSCRGVVTTALEKQENE